MSASTPSDGLILTDTLKDYGVSAITRHGSIGRGFAIQVMIYGKPLVIAADVSWSNLLKNLANKLDASYYFKGDTSTVNRIKKDFLTLLESTLIQNHAWVTGQDIKQAQSGYTSKHDENTSDVKNSPPQELSIPDAIRAHSGDIIISGIIVTMSDIYKLVENAKWICYACNEPITREVKNILDIPVKPRECTNENCKSKLGFSDNHDYKNAVTLGIQPEDISIDSSLGILKAVVFGNDTYDIKIGSRADILGEIVNQQDPRTKKFNSVLLVKRIQYKHRKKIEITPDDIRAFEKFIKFPNYEERLVSMFAPDVIGLEDQKLSLLVSVIGAPDQYNKQTKRISVRGKINALAIGSPGEAKTKILYWASHLRLNSINIFGKDTTGGSLTAMILMENDHLTLHLGAAAMADNAILFVNEFDKLPANIRDHLLEVAENSQIIVNKFAQVVVIPARTNLFASANPRDEKWMYPNEITLEEIPFSLRELSRFDSIIIFRDENTKEANQRYGHAKLDNIKKHMNVNDNFLMKLIEYIKTISPTLTSRAQVMLVDYWDSLRANTELTYYLDKRSLEIIYRFASAFARMNLSWTIDEKIAQKTIDFMDKMLSNFNLKVSKKNDPFMDAYTKTIQVLQRKKIPEKAVELVSLIESISQRYQEIGAYIGTIFQQDKNIILRSLCTKILETPGIKRTKAHPIKVYWESVDNDVKISEKGVNDVNDVNDVGKETPHPRSKKNSRVNTHEKNKNKR